MVFFFQAEDGIRYWSVTGVQTCALPISADSGPSCAAASPGVGEGGVMPLRLGDEAPDFRADTTDGPIHFYQWMGNQWVMLFSHPKDFTPVCTTELGYLARLQPEFMKRGCKIIGLSVDSVDDHRRWARDIEETQAVHPAGGLPASLSGGMARSARRLGGSLRARGVTGLRVDVRCS